MANTTKTLAKDGSWTELTGGGTPATSFLFVNRGPATVIVQYNLTAAPVDVNGVKAGGVPYKPGQGEKLTTLGRVWARTELPDAAVGSPAEVHCEES